MQAKEKEELKKSTISYKNKRHLIMQGANKEWKVVRKQI